MRNGKKYIIGNNDDAYAYSLNAAKVAALTLWAEGDGNPVPVFTEDGKPVGIYAGGEWTDVTKVL